MATAKDTPKKQAPSAIKARVLVDGVFGRADQVVSLTADQLAQAQATGQVDAHPDAVAHAQTLSINATAAQ